MQKKHQQQLKKAHLKPSENWCFFMKFAENLLPNEAVKFTLLEVERKQVWNRVTCSFEAQDIMPVSVSADHRVLDGFYCTRRYFELYELALLNRAGPNINTNLAKYGFNWINIYFQVPRSIKHTAGTLDEISSWGPVLAVGNNH